MYDALREAFQGDNITRIKKGEPGADIRHEVMHKGEVCGTILYDSKNRQLWQNAHAQKTTDPFQLTIRVKLVKPAKRRRPFRPGVEQERPLIRILCPIPDSCVRFGIIASDFQFVRSILDSNARIENQALNSEIVR